VTDYDPLAFLFSAQPASPQAAESEDEWSLLGLRGEMLERVRYWARMAQRYRVNRSARADVLDALLRYVRARPDYFTIDMGER
jgi:hypothetical protein